MALLFLLSCNGKESTKDISKVNKAVSTAIQDDAPPVKYTSGDVVTKIFLDSSGKMWFATTDEGVFQYDGKTFKRFTIEDGLCGNDIWSIVEAQDGTMWFGTSNGLCKFNGATFETIPIPKDTTESDWLRSVYPVVNPNGVSSLLQDRNGIFWIGSNGAGAYRYDGKEFTSYLKNRGQLMPDSLHHNAVVSIIEDNDGDIWFSSFSHGGVSKFDGESFTHYDTDDGLGDDMIASSYIDRSGKLWFGTRGRGMSYFNGKDFTTIYQEEGTCHNNMATLLEDRTGKLWMASYARSGVCWYDGESFFPLEVEGSDQLVDIKCIGEDKDGNIWFGGRYGILWCYDGTALKDFTYLKRSGLKE
jgi:ligand-binding sensor domain-containing protein